MSNLSDSKSLPASHLKDYVTENGMRVKLRSVPYTLTEELANQVKDPSVPVVWNETKREFIPNPLDPGYLKALEDAERQRARIVNDAILRIGVVLEEGVPPLEQWLYLLEEMNDLRDGKLFEGYDITNPKHLETLYKRYFVIVTFKDLVTVNAAVTTTPEGVREALALFQTNKKR